ncbi:cell division protein FtsI (penicillin-binding protein 3) [Mucilaginibacter yixingensis]|uniref:Cell division protein FtsI (Penicillin-binding protein 3) n=1 Tax=Mucilaginibacter yixingensis TaxID=1295612 RepID=A0A2T5J795_9SPHI|nr:penicillin-binding protein [Mucilaginibacter yixingensis]PTQ95020.1 cell division protein FtsI (penicillin-binding protein 3) [Mucilaginibacter yixingensis]
MNIRANILLRAYLAFGLILLFALAVVVQLCRVQMVQGKKWRAMADSLSTKYVNVEAARGNILAVDGSLLATSVPEYELHMDMLAAAIDDSKKGDAFFNEKVDSLALCLSKFFQDRSARDYERMLRSARSDSARYVLLNKAKVSYRQLKQIRQFPIIRMGKYKGGLIVVEKNKRMHPFQSMALRTIGYKMTDTKDKKPINVGLEGAYADYIEGENGKRLMHRIAGGIWMPVNDEDEVAAKDGADIMSTIDVNLQDVAQKVLKKQLDSTQADFGTVVLMEVATGEVRAIANYTRTTKGTYEERMNYAIAQSAEPGSTFKLASYMSLIDDHKIDTSSMVDAQHGRFEVTNPRNGKVVLHIRDAEDPGSMLSAKRAFEESSNVAAARFVYNAYHDNPQKFIDKLYSYRLNEKDSLQIPGEGKPRIKTTRSVDWNKLQSLWQIAYGYESKLTPLQMLTFYNSVANNGKMIAPVFVREIRRMGNTVERFHARVINPKVCSDATLAKVRGMLEGVVLEGTGKLVIKNKLYSVAGKTGTAQIANGAAGYGAKNEHQASFCGYFPADHPKYSMIVVIHNPRVGSHLAAWVAGPVFRKIADRVYANDMDINHKQPERLVGNTEMPKVKNGNYGAVKQVYNKLGIKPLYASTNAQATGVDTSGGLVFDESKYKAGTVPSVSGMSLSDALYVLGNAGYKVSSQGSGVVVGQSVAAGTAAKKGTRISIQLQ